MTWTGVYGGLGVGADALTPHFNGTLAGANLDADGLGSADVAGTLVLGYDRQVLPDWVVGVFGLVDFGGNGRRHFTISAPGGTITTELPAVERSWTVGGRAGYLVAPDTLVYALAGYSGTTIQRVSYNLAVASGTIPATEFHGATFGGGFEKLFTQNVSARVEYRHTRLDNVSLAASGFTSANADVGVHAARLVLSYRLPAK